MNKDSNNPLSPIAQYIWENKYRDAAAKPVESGIEDSWHRIARALAEVESNNQAGWEQQFFSVLQNFLFIPGGRVLAGAGTSKQTTLFNCFVMGSIDDSINGIFEALKQGAITMQQGGGVGYDFSTLRPHGVKSVRVGATASGPVSFMRIWDAMCNTILSTGARRGAMMATLRCDHPDIEQFITAKKEPGALRHFNLSIQITDEFIQAVKKKDPWPLVFPINSCEDTPKESELVLKPWPGSNEAVACRVFRTVNAHALWQKIMQATYDYAEPGVLFVDRINTMNNLWYCERISSTNPCGEIPLPPYGACDLGSLNLSRFIQHPFSNHATIDFDRISAVTAIAVRMLDNVIDLSHYPLELQRQQAQGSRRIGLGITGLADCLFMLGLRYGDTASLEMAAKIVRCISYSAYRSSVDLAKEKGTFPFFDKEKYLQSKFIKSLPDDIQNGIRHNGIRNSHLIAIAPTGTISLLANNVSSGIEPIFNSVQKRKILQHSGRYREFELEDYSYALWKSLKGDARLDATFVNTFDISPEQHLAMQAALQPHVDNAISKTIHVSREYGFEKFESLYMQAYEQGLKGCTTYRSNPITGSILQKDLSSDLNKHCCSLEREAD